MNPRLTGYGWSPDLPDHRDFQYVPTAIKLPKVVDLRNLCPPVYNQGLLGSCTANAIGGAFQYELINQKAPVFMPSRLFIYYNERVIENDINIDGGAQLRDGIKTVHKQGVCPEEMWPYNPNEFAQKPHLVCYTEALKHQVLSYHRVTRDIKQMKNSLAEGHPFVFGFTVYENFEGTHIAKTGILNLPKKTEKLMGGHAVVAVGYDDPSERFIVRNSWGEDWGQKGYFTMPYDYLLDENLSDDFWHIQLVEVNPIKVKAGKKKKK
jgi:C1A family cysteine protease